MIIIVVIWSWSHHGFSSAMTPIPSWSPGPATWSAARWNSSDWPRVKRSRGKRMGSKMGKRNPQIAIFMDIIHDIYWYMILYIYNDDLPMVGMGTLFSDKPKYRFDEYAERWKLVHAQHSVEISRRWKFAVDGQWVDYMPWGPQSLDPDLYPIGCPKRQPQGHRFGPLPSLWGSSYRQRRWAGAECALLPHWGWVKTHDFPYERGMNIDNKKSYL